MRYLTDTRGPYTQDELWLCEHPPVFTQGLAGKAEHLLAPGEIPVVATNRGGQVTYHGPGQVVAYPLLDLKRRGYFVKDLVYRIEEAVIRALRHFGVTGHRVSGAPGIYVKLNDPFAHSILLQKASMPKKAGEKIGVTEIGVRPNFEGLGKIAALGIKVSRHCSYHGVALNVAMDLGPFLRINPCGYAGLPTIDLASLGVNATPAMVAVVLSDKLQATLG
ncbi:MAG: lipoyl(octanoyl) transferase LipB [Alphaproteobacteria bacterium]|nr:lipoyl(octanoyl) transferase LipB [Alphaproteobacteria bacterium]